VTLDQYLDHTTGIYPSPADRLHPWALLASGDILLVVDDPRLAFDAQPPETVEVIFAEAPRGTWRYAPSRPGLYRYLHTYVSVERRALLAYLQQQGGIIGVIDLRATIPPASLDHEREAHALSSETPHALSYL